MHKTTRHILAAALAFMLTLALKAQAQPTPQDTLLILGGTGNPPYEYIDDDNNPAGFNVELFEKLMDIIKRPYKLELIPWKDAYAAVANGKADVVMGMVYTPHRSETIKFGRATAYINLKWIVKKNSDFFSEKDLKDKRIACRNSGFANLQLRIHTKDYHVFPTESNVKAFKMLFDGKCDAILCDEIIARYISARNSEYKGEIRIINSTFVNSEYRITANWKNDKLLEEIEYALNKLRNDGEYDKIYDKWFYPEREYRKSRNTAIIVAVTLGAIAGLCMLIVFWFNRKLHSSTRHIRTLNNRLNSQLKTLSQQNEELTKARQKADIGVTAMKTLFSNITHELRTPMNAIQGFTQLLADENISNEDRIYMEMQVKKSTKELTDLINSMIQLAELDAGAITVHRELFCINDLIDSITNLHRSLNDNPDLIITKDIPTHRIWVELDRRLTNQCIGHFMSNSVKFTKKGHITLGIKAQKDGIVILIEDTGIGMTNKQIRDIFKRFEQKDTFTPGLGLGLHIAASIISNSDGKIETISQPDEGTTFKVFIPCKIIVESASHA